MTVETCLGEKLTVMIKKACAEYKQAKVLADEIVTLGKLQAQPTIHSSEIEERYEIFERTMNYTVTYDGADVRGAVVTVRTIASSSSNRRAPAVSIDYQMMKVGDVWRVFDISTDGVSLVRNYRTQFNRIIERDGWDALITRMRDRL